jgi:hypothetical protein
MIERKSIEAVIIQAKSSVIQQEAAAEQVGDLRTRAESRDRQIFLDNLLVEFGERKIGRIPSKSVFVSYSKETGGYYFDQLRPRLEAIGFEVVTGFQKALGDRDIVLTRILNQLRRSTVYLGLLTKEMRVKGPDNRNQWSPSVWTMEEKGMALALGTPFVLLVQEGIHNDYWLKTAPDRVHLTFTRMNFKDKVKEALGAVRDRYDELIVGSNGRGDISRFFPNRSGE